MEIKATTVSILFTCLVCSVVSSPVTVTTDMGEIIGETAEVTIDSTGFHVDTYLGIPYAKPPVDDLRFSKPVPLQELAAPYNATKYSDACLQFSYFPGIPNPPQSEDCLYLNVFVPRNNDTNAKYAVMVYFYGGGFDWGSSDIFDGKYLAAYGDVIVVTLNYRLGPLGFWRLDDTHAPGNVGLWDQRLALQWINQHIHSFGGNKSEVTLFGNSVGGMSAIIHALYPNNTGLFQRIISQSGSVSTLHYSINAENTPEVQYVVNSLGCTSKNISEMLHCLRKIPMNNFTADVKKFSIEARKSIMSRAQFYVPNYDGTLINWNAKELWRTDDINSVNSVEFFRSIDFLNGFDKYDAAGVLQILLNISDAEEFEPSETDMQQIIGAALRMGFNKTFSDKVNKFVMSEYTDWNDPSNPERIRLKVVNLYTDMINSVPAIELSQIHARNHSSGSNYMFLFTADPTVHVLKTPSWIPGASHSDEMLFLAGIDRFPFASQWEKELSHQLMKYWSNFAKSGNPNEASADMNSITEWPQYEITNQTYIDLSRNIAVKRFLNARATNFWKTLLPDLITEIPDCEDCATCETSVAAVTTLTWCQVWLVLVARLFFHVIQF